VSWRVRPAADWLRAGGVVAYPTEAVFGLGCDPLNQAAVLRLLAIKGRSVRKGLIVIADDPGRLEGWIEPLCAPDRRRMESSWPGPVTWVVAARAWVPPWLTGGSRRLAVRVTAHPLAAALARAFGAPIVSTSANRSGAEPARRALEARLRLGRLVDHVMPGAVGGAGAPSQIRELRTGRTLRAGGG
jgi:L-threonylcarbamoyladenylate synthase